MNRAKQLLLVALALVISACATTGTTDPSAKKSIIHDAELFLGTDDADSQKYHAIVHYPFEHSLRYPGMIIGIEKSKADAVKQGANAAAIRTTSSLSKSKADEWLSKLLINEPKSMFISHVVRTKRLSNSPPVDQKPCFAYNAYKSRGLAGDDGRKAQDDIIRCDESQDQIKDYFSGSWSAIDRVKATLQSELRGGTEYTHVVLIVMGWNTEQIEAVQNFNSIVHRLEATVKDRNTENDKNFRPYVIGVTWPSEWDSGWAEPVVRFASLKNKANDADEVGGGWLGAILEYGILPVTGEVAASKTKLMVIGHSFGARATSHAVCRGTLLKAPDSMAKAPDAAQVDWLIGLQGAYSLNRFSAKGAGPSVHLNYPEQCQRARRLLFTASRNDVAASMGGIIAPEGDFAGTFKSFETMRDEGLPNSDIQFATFATTVSPGDFTSRGDIVRIPGAAVDPNSRFCYVDASNVIHFKAFSSGAGAHSDIYRTDTARMIWNVIDIKSACGNPK